MMLWGKKVKSPLKSLLMIFVVLSMSRINFPEEPGEKSPRMEGKEKTDLSIVLDFIVDGSPEKVFRLWTTVPGIKSFFATDAVVDLKPQGAYEIYFLPRTDPRSDANSTKGAKLLAMEQGKKLVFEWALPPWAGELNTKPLPTWVEVSFQALETHSGKTHIQLSHYGFQRGGKWGQAYEFFVRNWALIMFRLDKFCAGHF